MIDIPPSSWLALLVASAGYFWLLFRDVFMKFVCVFRGHVFDESLAVRLDGGEVETKCGRCGFHLLLYVDPDDPSHYVVTDDW